MGPGICQELGMFCAAQRRSGVCHMEFIAEVETF